MVVVTSDAQFDITDLDLNYLIRNNDYRNVQLDAGVTINNAFYEDVYGFVSLSGERYRTFGMYGYGFEIDNSGTMTSGSVRALVEGDLNTQTYLYVIQGLLIDGASLYDAMSTESNADELAIFAAALSGNDTINLSPFDDRMIGYAGHDNIRGGGGDDVIDGGVGTDVAIFAGALSSATVSFDGSTVIITVPGEGTDRLTNVEYAKFGQVMRSIESLRDLAAPMVAIFSPADNATGIARTTNFAVTFNEAVVKGTGLVVLRSGSIDGTIVEQFDVGTSNRIALMGATLTINPTANLLPGVTYFVTVGGGAVVDHAGNAFAGTSAFDFTVQQPDLDDASNWRAFAANGFAGEIGGSGLVFGTDDFQDIKVLDLNGTITFDGSFNKGGDIVRLAGIASNWAVSRAGSNAVLSDGDTNIILPFGRIGTEIEFADGVRTLRIQNTTPDGLRLGERVVSSAPTPVAGDGEPVSLSGAISSANNRIFVASNGEVHAGGKVAIFGTPDSENIYLTQGSVVFDGSFNKGGDTIHIAAGAGLFTATASGTSARFTSAVGVDFTLPVGKVGTTLAFEDDARTLLLNTTLGVILLDDQVITTLGTVI